MGKENKQRPRFRTFSSVFLIMQHYIVQEVVDCTLTFNPAPTYPEGYRKNNQRNRPGKVIGVMTGSECNIRDYFLGTGIDVHLVKVDVLHVSDEMMATRRKDLLKLQCLQQKLFPIDKKHGDYNATRCEIIPGINLKVFPTGDVPESTSEDS